VKIKSCLPLIALGALSFAGHARAATTAQTESAPPPGAADTAAQIEALRAQVEILQTQLKGVLQVDAGYVSLPRRLPGLYRYQAPARAAE